MRDKVETDILNARMSTEEDKARGFVPAEEIEGRMDAFREELNALIEKHSMHAFIATYVLVSPGGEHHGRTTASGCAGCCVKGSELMARHVPQAVAQAERMATTPRRRSH